MLNVLVVDDSVVMRRMVIRTLQMSGIPIGQVFEAENGQVGLEVASREWVDLALIDINMPVLDGQTMIERLRASELTRDMAVLVVSTDITASRREALKDCNVTFVEKPFTPEKLRAEALRATGLEESEHVAEPVAPSGELDF